MTIATIILIAVCIYGLLSWANSRVGMDAPNTESDYFAEKPAIFDDKTVLMWDGKAFSVKPVHIDYMEGCEWPERGRSLFNQAHEVLNKNPGGDVDNLFPKAFQPYTYADYLADQGKDAPTVEWEFEDGRVERVKPSRVTRNEAGWEMDFQVPSGVVGGTIVPPECSTDSEIPSENHHKQEKQ